MQSLDEPIVPDINESRTEEQNVLFVDGDQNVAGIKAKFVSRGDPTPTMSLAGFLNRPVLINTINWAISDTVGSNLLDITPWSAYLSNTYIASKLRNFAFIRGNLKIKYVINASPFYYGALLVNYTPLHTFNSSTTGQAFDTGTRYLIPESQKPNVMLYPQDSEGAEMTLPFFYYYNKVPLITARTTELGRLQHYIYAPLRSANSVTSSTVTIQVFAWMEDVEISGPTAGLVMQSQTVPKKVKKPSSWFRRRKVNPGGPAELDPPPDDEYTISETATAVSEAMSKLVKIPIIGEYATCSQMGCDALAAGAKALGYSNIPVVSNTEPLRNEPFPNIASAEISYPVHKMTLDPKGEMSIDPTLVGLGPVDELSIPYLVQKSSYLCTANWSTTNAVNDILFTSAVTPVLFDYLNRTAESTHRASGYYQTPMCWVSQMFNYWRGDIIFTFKIVCSPFHKGRLRVSYDPYGTTSDNINATTGTTPIVFTQVVDISVNNTVELRIPYQQAQSFLHVGDLKNVTVNVWEVNTSTTSNFNIADFANGSLNVRVNTVLSAPVATAPISILISVRGAENLEFASPGMDNYTDRRCSYFTMQSDDVFQSKADSYVAGQESIPDDTRYLTYFGEVIPSLRQLLRRTTHCEEYPMPSNTTSAFTTVRHVISRFPNTPGYDPNGSSLAVSLISTGNKPFNYSTFTPLSWIMPAFIGTRGSINLTISNNYIGSGVTTTIARLADSSSTAVEPVVTSSSYAVSTPTAKNFLTVNSQGCTGGGDINSIDTQSGVNVVLPNYTNLKFGPTDPGLIRNTSTSQVNASLRSDFHLICNRINTTVTGVSNLAYTLYRGIGADFNLHFFLNVPVLYRASTAPTPP